MKTIGKLGKVGFSVVIVLVIAMIAGCQSGPPKISIDGARAEMSSIMIGEAVVTMSIKNEGGPDMLTAVRIDIPGATTMFHIMQGERMAMVDRVKIPAKSSTEFKMGGSHIMIEDLPKTVKEGSQFNMTLIFQQSGEKQVQLTLQGPSTMPMGR